MTSLLMEGVDGSPRSTLTEAHAQPPVGGQIRMGVLDRAVPDAIRFYSDCIPEVSCRPRDH